MNELAESIRLMDLKAYVGFNNLARWLSLHTVMELLANPWLWMPVFGALTTIYLSAPSHRRRHAWAAFFGICTWFLAIQLSDLMSTFLFKQPSPSTWHAVAGQGLMPKHPYSMPDWFSASLSAYLTFTLAHLPIGRRWHKVALWLALIPLASTARICAGEAFPTHVLVGLVTGQLVAILFHIFFRNFRIVMLREPA